MDGSEADGDLVLVQTFLLYYVNQVILMLTSIFQEHNKAKEVCIKTRSRSRSRLTDVLTCLLNLILFAISIHTPKIFRQSFKYVTFGDEQTVHLKLSLKKGKCMVFKPRQVQDIRIVKFKEIVVINIMIVRV